MKCLWPTYNCWFLKIFIDKFSSFAGTQPVHNIIFIHTKYACMLLLNNMKMMMMILHPFTNFNVFFLLFCSLLLYRYFVYTKMKRLRIILLLTGWVFIFCHGKLKLSENKFSSYRIWLYAIRNVSLRKNWRRKKKNLRFSVAIYNNVVRCSVCRTERVMCRLWNL